MTITFTRVFHAPQAAVYDGAWGEWVPCRVLKVDEEGDLSIRITAHRRGYAKGQTIHGVGQGRVRPKAISSSPAGQTRYEGTYRWEEL